MIVLRIEQSATPDERHRVSVRLEGDGPPAAAVCEFAYRLTDADREDVRWYFEEYVRFPEEAAPRVAERIERRLADFGTMLFERVFGTAEAESLWRRVRDRLPIVRIEISSDVAGSAVLPWELLRDPTSGLTIALEVESFVRVNTGPSVPYPPLSPDERTLRVLLVICRPEAGADVPFRSVAGRIVRLQSLAAAGFQIDVVRPPTFERLASALENARAAGEPYRVVHFDGHGTYVDARRFQPEQLLSPPRPGPNGYLLFEDPSKEDNTLIVDGPALGALLARTGVVVLVLNACLSAYTEEPHEPVAIPRLFAVTRDQFTYAIEDPRQAAAGYEIASYVTAPVASYGSLAQEVTDAGVAGVVAMRYSVLVVTAAQFVVDLYAALLAGQPLGMATTLGRKQLAAAPLRKSHSRSLSLQDWSVPVVYEPTPLVLFHDVATPSNFTGQPAGGFIGRDETLLAIDRSFDRWQFVLLHGGPGTGKTATAAEFGRWYATTGGLDAVPGMEAAALFTSLEQRTTVSEVLDAFGAALAGEGVPWPNLDEDAKRRLVMDTVANTRVLWIWDGVEAATGFPPGARAVWNAAERSKLLGLLHELTGTRARLLLTSRLQEREWLGDLVVRIGMPRMPMFERIDLAVAEAANRGRRITDAEAWRMLLRSTAGNPLMIRVLVAQAVRQNRTDPVALQAFAGELQRGEAAIDDDPALGRTESVDASMSYGFDAAFSRRECAQLAMLHLFHGSVDVAALTSIGDPGNAASLPELVELTRPVALALLDRAAELGLLTPVGDGRYLLHPALPWYVGRYYAATYGPRERHDRIVLHAFAAAIARFGRRYADLYRAGHAEVITQLEADEANLLNAASISLRRGQWTETMSCMQGLRVLYRHFGRQDEWESLLRQLLTHHPGIDALTSEQIAQWRQLLEFQVELARSRREWSEAERIIRTVLHSDSAHAAGALAESPEGRDRLRQFAVSLTAVGHILRERGSADCLDYYRSALEVWHSIDDVREVRLMHSHLGDACIDVPDLRDLDQARERYWACFDSTPEHDHLGQAAAMGRLARVERERFLDSRRSGEPEPVWRSHLDHAEGLLAKALNTVPRNATGDYATYLNALGIILVDAGRLDEALRVHRSALTFYDETDRFQAGLTRLHAARALAAGKSVQDALEYARAALTDFISGGAANLAEAAETEELIRDLSQRLPDRPGRDEPDDGAAGVMVGV